MSRGAYIAQLIAVNLIFIPPLVIAAHFGSKYVFLLVLTGQYVALRWVIKRQQSRGVDSEAAQAMPIDTATTTACPWCGKRVEWAPRYYSKPFLCPHCHNRIKDAPLPRLWFILVVPVVVMLVSRMLGASFNLTYALITGPLAIVGFFGYIFTAHVERA